MKNKTALSKITLAIVYLRGKAVILDSELARIYGVDTKALNQAVKRNKMRFPGDFMFKMTCRELAENRSQFVTGSERHRDPRFRPFAFTEQGAIMAANVLNSTEAARMSVFVVRAFVRMRAMLLGRHDLAEKLAQLEKMLTSRLDTHEKAIVHVLQRVMKLLEPPSDEPYPRKPKGPIGFEC